MVWIRAAILYKPGIQGPPGCISDRFFVKSCRNRTGEGVKIHSVRRCRAFGAPQTATALCMSVSHMLEPRMSMPAASAGVLYIMPPWGLM